jgi:hypothetical protein
MRRFIKPTGGLGGASVASRPPGADRTNGLSSNGLLRKTAQNPAIPVKPFSREISEKPAKSLTALQFP